VGDGWVWVKECLRGIIQHPQLENYPYPRFMSGLFLESVGMVAQGPGIHLDETRTLQELELASTEFEVAGRPVRPGTVAGPRYGWQGPN
jgi:hypothetical protein